MIRVYLLSRNRVYKEERVITVHIVQITCLPLSEKVRIQTSREFSVRLGKDKNKQEIYKLVLLTNQNPFSSFISKFFVPFFFVTFFRKTKNPLALLFYFLV